MSLNTSEDEAKDLREKLDRYLNNLKTVEGSLAIEPNHEELLSIKGDLLEIVKILTSRLLDFEKYIAATKPVPLSPVPPPQLPLSSQAEEPIDKPQIATSFCTGVPPACSDNSFPPFIDRAQRELPSVLRPDHPLPSPHPFPFSFPHPVPFSQSNPSKMFRNSLPKSAIPYPQTQPLSSSGPVVSYPTDSTGSSLSLTVENIKAALRNDFRFAKLVKRMNNSIDLRKFSVFPVSVQDFISMIMTATNQPTPPIPKDTNMISVSDQRVSAQPTEDGGFGGEESIKITHPPRITLTAEEKHFLNQLGRAKQRIKRVLLNKQRISEGLHPLALGKPRKIKRSGSSGPYF